MALKREFRLRKSNDFQRVRQQGRSIASRLLILAWTPNNVAELRVGFVVSKRISKHAVKRNYSKRLLSEAMRPLLADIATGWDIVLTARHPLLDADLPMLSKDVAILLRRARLITITQQVETSSP